MTQDELEAQLVRLRKEIDELSGKSAVVFTEKLANPAPLGLAAFGLTTLVLNVVNSGIISHDDNVSMVWPLGLMFGGLAQLLAGMWEAKKNNTFGMTAFSAFGAFWMALGLLKVLQAGGVVAAVSPSGMSVFLVCWGIFTAYMFVGTIKISHALQAVFGTLVILFFLLAIGQHNDTWEKIGGYEGLLCAGTALYTSAALVINDTWGRQVLPLGTVKPPAQAPASALPRARTGVRA